MQRRNTAIVCQSEPMLTVACFRVHRYSDMLNNTMDKPESDLRYIHHFAAILEQQM